MTVYEIIKDVGEAIPNDVFIPSPNPKTKSLIVLDSFM